MNKSNIGKGVIGALLAVLALAVVLDATGGRLAQPERAGAGQDRFVGFHLVYEYMDIGGEGIVVDRTHWTEYGQEELQISGLGSVPIPREILIGQYDEAEHRYVFPGMDGLNCFLAERTEEDGSTYVGGYSDMANTEFVMGSDNSIRGTAYMGPSTDEEREKDGEDMYIWTAYKVYQMEDGTVYLDGTGDSFGGRGGFTVLENSEYTTTVNGESTAGSMEAEFSLEYVERLSDVTVTWFDEGDRPVGVRKLTPEEIGRELTLPAPEGAAWVMVKEIEEPGTVRRAAYDLTDQREGGGYQMVMHELILLEENGRGCVANLILEPCAE